MRNYGFIFLFVWTGIKFFNFSKTRWFTWLQVLYHAVKHVYQWVCMEWRDGFSILCLTGMFLQLDLNLLNQIPLIIGSLFVWDGDFFLPLLLLLKPLLALVFLANNFGQFGNAGVRACLKGRLLMLLKPLTIASTWSGSVKKQWRGIIL